VPDDDPSGIAGTQDVPALVLAAAVVTGGVVLVGMHLDTEVLVRVEDLHLEGERVGLQSSEEVAALDPQVRQAHAGEPASPHDAIALGTRRDRQALADLLVRGERVAVQVVQAGAAPDLREEDGLEEDQLAGAGSVASVGHQPL